MTERGRRYDGAGTPGARSLLGARLDVVAGAADVAFSAPSECFQATERFAANVDTRPEPDYPGCTASITGTLDFSKGLGRYPHPRFARPLPEGEESETLSLWERAGVRVDSVNNAA